MCACRNNNKDVVELLLSRGAGEHIPDGDYSLVVAIKNKNKEIINLLLKFGIKVDAWSFCFMSGNGDEEMVEAFLRTGANPNMETKDGMTPLYEAIRRKRVGVVELLLKTGANPDGNDAGHFTPLMFACREGYTEIAQLLLNAGAGVNLQDYIIPWNSWTALMYASQEGHTDIVRLLLRHGADKYIMTDGMFAIDLARRSRHKEIVEMLENAE